MHAVTRLLGSATQALLDLLFPPSCGACRAPMPGLAMFCTDCAQHVQILGDPRCPRCGLPGGEADCPDCALIPDDQVGEGFDAAAALFAYGGPVEEAQGRVKFGQAPHLAVAAGQAIAERLDLLGEGLRLPEVDLICAVPVGAGRLRQRGYDQAVLMAKPIARALGKPCAPHLLRRTRETKAQAQLPRAERQANVAGAFAVKDKEAVGRRLLLVDDVMTTGATCHAAASALKRAGAVRVEVLCLARATIDRD